MQGKFPGAGRAVAAALLTLTLHSAGAAADPTSRPFAEITARWQARRSEIATAVISYRTFHNGVDGQRTLDDFNALLDAGTLDQTPEGFRQFITGMNGAPFRVDPPWEHGTITCRDALQRNDLGPFVTVEDRENSIYYDTLNQQFDVAWRGGSLHRHETLESFRPLPPQPWTPDRWRLSENAGELTLQRFLDAGKSPPLLDSRIWFVDSASGLVTRIVRQNAEGAILSIARYLDIAELPGAIAFPRIAVEATLQHGVVTTLHARVIDGIRLNEPVPDEAFHLPAPARSKVVDERGGRRIVLRLDQPQPDVMTWVRQHVPSPPPSSAARRSTVDLTTRNMLLTGNGLLLVTIGLMLWKRQRSRGTATEHHPPNAPASTPPEN